MTTGSEYRCEACGTVDTPSTGSIIHYGDSQLPVHRWSSEAANAVGAHHFCGEAHAEVEAFPKRRNLNGKDIESVEEPSLKLPESTATFRSRLVAANARTSTEIGWLPPTRSNSRSWSTRKRVI